MANNKQSNPVTASSLVDWYCVLITPLLQYYFFNPCNFDYLLANDDAVL
jgi:hypothetical protein